MVPLVIPALVASVEPGSIPGRGAGYQGGSLSESVRVEVS
nr:MAG TPA: hypothetical protein [Caudoviricetes sp.]